MKSWVGIHQPVFGYVLTIDSELSCHQSEVLASALKQILV